MRMLKNKKAVFWQTGLLGIFRLALTTPLGWVITGLLILFFLGIPILSSLVILFNIKNIFIIMAIVFGLTLLLKKK